MDIVGYLPFMAIYGLVLSLVVFLNFKYRDISSSVFYKKRQNLINLSICLLLVLTAVLFRIYLINEYPAPPVNDAIIAFDAARSWVSGPSYSLAEFVSQHWGIYAVLLSFVFKIFGSTLVIAKSVSVFAAAVSVAAIFYALLIKTKKLLLAATGAFLVAAWPSFALYVNFLSGDHVFVMFFSLAILALILVEKSIADNAYKKYFGYLLLFSVLISIAGVFKEMNIITIPAAIITIVYLITNIKNITLSKLKLSIVTILIIIAVAFGITAASNSIVSYYAMGPVNTHKLGYFIATGLNNETGGRYNEKIAKSFLDPIKLSAENNRLDESVYREVDSQMFNIAKNEITNNLDKMPMLLVKKINTVWSNEDEINNWNYDAYTLTDTKPVAYSMEELRDKLSIFNIASNSFMLFIMVLAFLGIWSFILKKQSMSSDIIFISFVVVGFSVSLVIIEVMTRYRSILYVSIAVLATYGVSCLIDKTRVHNS